MEADKQPAGPGSLAQWYDMRSRSWARANRRMLRSAWLLAGAAMLCFSIVFFIDIGNPLAAVGSPLPLAVMSACVILGMLLSLGLSVLWVLLAISRIGYCLPGTELIGGQSDSAYMWQVQRGSFLLALRMACLLLLPVGLSALAMRVTVSASVLDSGPLLPLLQLCGELLYIVSLAVIVSFIVLRLPKLAAGMQLLLTLLVVWLSSGLGIMLTFLVAGIADMLVEDPSYDLLLVQELCKLSARLIPVLVLLLLASRQPPEQFIEQLSESGN